MEPTAVGSYVEQNCVAATSIAFDYRFLHPVNEGVMNNTGGTQGCLPRCADMLKEAERQPPTCGYCFVSSGTGSTFKFGDVGTTRRCDVHTYSDTDDTNDLITYPELYRIHTAHGWWDCSDCYGQNHTGGLLVRSTVKYQVHLHPNGSFRMRADIGVY